MARTLDPEKHQLRRASFLDVAQQLIQTRGYEQTSIQDVLDALGTSRGAFYHYFASKEALRDAVVERFAEAGMAAVQPIRDDPRLPALRKLEQIVRGIAQFKAEQRDLVIAIIDVWNSDGNALVREKLRRMTASRLEPLLAAVIRQGVAEDIVRSDAPDETARVLVALVLGYQQLAIDQFVARRAGTITFEEVGATYAALAQAFERILGIPDGTLTLMDEQTLSFWFG